MKHLARDVIKSNSKNVEIYKPCYLILYYCDILFSYTYKYIIKIYPYNILCIL